MTETHIQLAGELLELEDSLRNLRLWTSQAPTAEALASVEPFACDTMAFTEWLQYLFIPRLHSLVEHGARLPEKCAVAPMAEEYFKSAPVDAATVLVILGRIDRLITDST
ncbi:MAG: hypothetical protein VR73_09900 [Gammaproteobacteria bacterium BRH_c0]|nr:MAG: hypothetical protein VR73_09900 [Gammaproteobacteria bacterium BRH_c0]